MIITIGMEKGGDGKSTVATNLAALWANVGKDVLLLDADQQGSSYLWNAVRDNNPDLTKITCFQKFGRVRDEIVKVSGKFDHIIVDTPGRRSVELQSALLVSDMLIVPLSIGFFDAWALKTMEELVLTALTVNEKLVTKVLINKASTNVTVDDRAEAEAVLEHYPALANLCQAVLHERRVYRYASGAGKSVTEMSKADKAAQEISTLFQEVACYGESKKVRRPGS